MAWVERSAGLAPAQNQWWRTFSISNEDLVVAYQPLGADNLAASLVNLVDPGTNDAVAIVNPTFATATGWTFDGTQHLTTGVTGDGLQTIMIRFDPNAIPAGTIAGNTGGQSTHWAIIGQLGGSWTTRFKYNTTTSAVSVALFTDGVMALARNKLYRNGALEGTVGALDNWSESDILIAQEIEPANGRFIGDIKAFAIYNRELTIEEILNISNNMNAIVSTDDPTPTPSPVNWIIQSPSTRHLNNASHELWTAADDGLFHTLNGGCGWGKATLPDPSNAEFSDSPAATIDELTFHWIDYDPSNENTLYAIGAKSSVKRIWIYKSTNTGESWTSRGVTTV